MLVRNIVYVINGGDLILQSVLWPCVLGFLLPSMLVRSTFFFM